MAVFKVEEALAEFLKWIEKARVAKEAINNIISMVKEVQPEPGVYVVNGFAVLIDGNGVPSKIGEVRNIEEVTKKN